MADEHDVHFESADAGASLTFPQQAGTIRKNGFIVIKNRPCKVSCQRRSLQGRTVSHVPPAHPYHLCRLMESCAAARHGPNALRLHSCMTRVRWALQVVDVSTSKTGKHGHAKCHFVALDIFTGKKLEDLQPSSHNSDVGHGLLLSLLCSRPLGRMSAAVFAAVLIMGLQCVQQAAAGQVAGQRYVDVKPGVQ